LTAEAQQAVHEALKEFLDEDEIPVCWVLTIEIARPDGNHLLHRAGGGINGTDNPMAWTALGMLQSAAGLAAQQVVDNTRDPDVE
jgi:hypothetical protein